jgi:hypothetical protein
MLPGDSGDLLACRPRDSHRCDEVMTRQDRSCIKKPLDPRVNSCPVSGHVGQVGGRVSGHVRRGDRKAGTGTIADAADVDTV